MLSSAVYACSICGNCQLLSAWYVIMMSVERRAGYFYDLRPLVELGLDEFGERLARVPRGAEALRREAILDVRRIERLPELCIQLAGDVGRRSCGNEQAVPRDRLVARKSRF